MTGRSQEQTIRAFALVPAFADIVRTAHPELEENVAISEAALLFSDTLDISALAHAAFERPPC